MNHTIRQQKMFDSITPKERLRSEPSVLEEMIKGIGVVFLGVVSVIAAWVVWMISKDYFDFIWLVFFN